MDAFRGLLTLLGRALLCAIFVLSTVGADIPKYGEFVATQMKPRDIPIPAVLLGVAIGFKLIGSVMVLIGWHSRCGALLLLFLLPATYYFHPFWAIDPSTNPGEFQNQMIHCLKNVALMGAMLLIMANGPGPWSLEGERDTGLGNQPTPSGRSMN